MGRDELDKQVLELKLEALVLALTRHKCGRLEKNSAARNSLRYAVMKGETLDEIFGDFAIKGGRISRIYRTIQCRLRLVGHGALSAGYGCLERLVKTIKMYRSR